MYVTRLFENYDTYQVPETRVSTGRDVPRDVPGQTGTGRLVVPLSRDKKKFLFRCPFVSGQGQEQKYWDKLLCPGTKSTKKLKKETR